MIKVSWVKIAHFQMCHLLRDEESIVQSSFRGNSKNLINEEKTKNITSWCVAFTVSGAISLIGFVNLTICVVW